MNLLKPFLFGAAACGALVAQITGTRQLPVYSDVSPDLVTMMLSQPPASVQAPGLYVHQHGPLVIEVGEAQSPSISAPVSQPALQNETVVAPAFSAIPGANFEGLGTGTTGFSVLGAPPDTTMAVGPNHVVQWVNSQLAIYNKSGLPLLTAPGFVTGNTLWSGFGGLCQSTNRGDPLVAYDKIADRWVFSQFAFNVSGSSPTTPYLQCFAVSQGSNPAGPYNRYAYDFSTIGPSGTAEFNDYGKIGIWPDAYYMTYNVFQGSPAGSNNGTLVCAHDRAAMIAGSASPAMLCAPVAFYAGGAAFLPTDMEGATTAPPAGSPNYIMRYSFGGISLRYIKFKVNNFSPGSFTFNDGLGGGTGSFINLPVGPTTVACNGAAGPCVPQPSTSVLLDTLADRLMYRLGYRNRAGVESLVTNISVDPDGAGAQQAAVRWFEVRSPNGSAPSLFQNATFSPDATNRWMASTGMDKNGNIAIGYSVSSASVFPGIRITGRLRSEIRNRMQTETTIVNGAGSQTGTLTRWGDYSTMRVDPADDCTFWFTTEYLGSTGTFHWRTRIASFKFPNCTP